MCEKVKIQNNGDWICPKCECENTELKENIKKINRTLCRSCLSEFELDKDESQNNQITIERDYCSNTLSVKVNDNETYIMTDDGVSGFVDGIQSILNDLGIESKIIK
jgi:hypothetical protein